MPSESLPIWSVVLPQVATTETNGAGSAGGLRLVSGKDRVRFTDVVQSFKGWMKLLKVHKSSTSATSHESIKENASMLDDRRYAALLTARKSKKSKDTVRMMYSSIQVSDLQLYWLFVIVNDI